MTHTHTHYTLHTTHTHTTHTYYTHTIHTLYTHYTHTIHTLYTQLHRHPNIIEYTAPPRPPLQWILCCHHNSHCKGPPPFSSLEPGPGRSSSAPPCCLLKLCNLQVAGPRLRNHSLDEMRLRGGSVPEMCKHPRLRRTPRVWGLIFPWFLRTS